MKLTGWIVMSGVLLGATGFTNSVEMVQEPYGSEADVAEQNKPRFIMPRPLSEMIVTPGKINVALERDPFEPLVAVEPPEVVEKKKQQEQQLEVFQGMEYAGVVKWGDNFSALIKTETEKGVFQVNDQIKQWTIIQISEEIITFQSGNKTYQLQRGDK